MLKNLPISVALLQKCNNYAQQIINKTAFLQTKYSYVKTPSLSVPHLHLSDRLSEFALYQCVAVCLR